MNRKAPIVFVILLLSSICFAQKRNSQEMGLGFSFWSISDGDSSRSTLNLNGVFATYFSRDFMFEIEPIVSINFVPDKVDLTGILLGGISKKIIDVSNVDRTRASSWNRKNERTTAGIYGSVSGGIWAERSDPYVEDPVEGTIQDTKIYVGPAFGVGIGTHSSLGSLTNIRTKFQYLYLMPNPPLYEEPRSMFTVTVGFGVITKL